MRKSKREIERALEAFDEPIDMEAPDRELSADEKDALRALVDPGQGEDVDVAWIQEQLAAGGGAQR